MPDTNFTARHANTMHMLADVRAIYDTYAQQRQNMSSETNHVARLEASKAQLQGELAKIRKSAAAYDREFQDRVESPRAQGLFERIGIRTIQDWVLFLFYMSLGCTSLLFMIYMVKTSHSKGKALGFGIGGTLVVLFGVTATLLRYV